jgi:hypothetical protein
VNATLSDRETMSRERDLISCRAAMGAPAPAQCTVSVVIRTKECVNVDGTPMEFLTPGSTSEVGCATDEETAEAAAKAGLSNQGVALSEGDQPSPNTCTYERNATFHGCLCRR